MTKKGKAVPGSWHTAHDLVRARGRDSLKQRGWVTQAGRGGYLCGSREPFPTWREKLRRLGANGETERKGEREMEREEGQPPLSCVPGRTQCAGPSFVMLSKTAKDPISPLTKETCASHVAHAGQDKKEEKGQKKRKGQRALVLTASTSYPPGLQVGLIQVFRRIDPVRDTALFALTEGQVKFQTEAVLKTDKKNTICVVTHQQEETQAHRVLARGSAFAGGRDTAARTHQKHNRA